MVEQADALDLESSGVTRAGSIPVIRTKILKLPPFIGLLLIGTLTLIINSNTWRIFIKKIIGLLKL